jgi:hypothetical protein
MLVETPAMTSVVCWLLIQFRDQIGPSGREVSATPRLFRSAGRSAVNVDQHYRQSVPAERVS